MDKEENKINFYNGKSIEFIEGQSTHSFPKHSHGVFCIGIIRNGRVLLKVKNQEHILEKNNIYFIPPYTEHTILSIDKVKYEYSVICINNKNIVICSNESPDNYVLKDEIIVNKFLNITRKIENVKDNDYIENMILELLKDYIKIDYNKKKETSKIALMSIEFIKNNLEEPFSLEKLCEYTNITKFHLIRVFKKQIGVGPYQFYIQEKIKQVRIGLVEEQSLSNLAFEFNFSDQSHMCNTFKKYIGITPIQFKCNYKHLGLK